MIRLPASGAPRVSILLLAFRDAEGLRRCLASLSAHLPGAIPSETIVLANGASDDVLAVLEREVQGARILRSRVNLGFARGCNTARRAAAGEYLVLLNEDAEIRPGWLEALVETADVDRSIGAVGGKMLDAQGRLVEAGQVVWADGSSLGVGRGEPPGAYEYVRDVDYCSAAALLVRAAAWDAVGGMDEEYYPAYYEDVDLCFALRAAGYRVVYQPRAAYVHDWSSLLAWDYPVFLQLRHRERFRTKWSEALSRREPPRPDDPAAVERAVLRARGLPRRILIVDDLLPTAVGSGFGRMLETVEELVDAGAAVTLCPRFDNGEERTSLQDVGVEIVTSRLRDHLARPSRLYDAILVSRPYHIEDDLHAIRENQPHAAVVYDCEALAYRRLLRQAAFAADDEARATLHAEAAAMEQIEHEIPSRVDHVVCVTEDEAAILRGVAGGCPVDVIATRSRVQPTPGGFAMRDDAVFVAGWLAGPDAPNVDGLRWFVQQVLPLVVERLPRFRLLVTGGNPPDAVRALAGPHLVLTGHVADLRSVYASARAALAPLRYGSGVKIKTLEALLHGVPVVATSVGAEGCGLEGHTMLAPVDDPLAFAARLALLMSDEAAWQVARGEVLSILEARRVAGGRSWPSVLEEVQLRRSRGRVAIHARD